MISVILLMQAMVLLDLLDSILCRDSDDNDDSDDSDDSDDDTYYIISINTYIIWTMERIVTKV